MEYVRFCWWLWCGNEKSHGGNVSRHGFFYCSLHWKHYFKYSVRKYNNIYKYQLPRITPHVCRHTYCTNMALSGVSAKILQYLMGHSDISITLNVYTYIKFDDAQKEVELIQTRQQKEMENVRKELEQVGEIQPKVIRFPNNA